MQNFFINYKEFTEKSPKTDHKLKIHKNKKL